jgi:hypothetical protein
LRNLFTCFLLCIVVWLIQRGPVPILEPAAFVGLLAVLPVILTEFAERSGIPAFTGALLAGLLLGPAGLLSDTAIASTQTFSEIALVWVGLYLGLSVTPSLISDRRYLVPALMAVISAAVVTSVVFVVVFECAVEDALQLGLLASVGAPILMLRSLSKQVETWSLSLLTSVLGLVLLGIVLTLRSALPDAVSAAPFLLEIGYWLIGVEVVNRCLHRIRTDWGRFFLFGTAALIIFLAAKHYGISSLLLASLSGLLLSFRFDHLDAKRISARVSQLLVPFVVAEFAARTIPSELALLSLSGRPLYVLMIYAFCVSSGKAASLFVARRFSADVPGAYFSVLPQGILAAGLFIPLLPPGLLALPIANLEITFVLVCGLGISLCTLPVRLLGGDGPVRPIPLSPEDDKAHLREI